MSLHNSYMIAVSALFAVVFAIMIHSTIKHRKTCEQSASPFIGTSGTVQWFWALLPLAILGFINYSLIVAPADHLVGTPKKAEKISLASAQNLPAAVPLATAGRVTDTPDIRSGQKTRK